MIADHRRHRQLSQFPVLQIARILALIAGCVDLVAGREQEIHIFEARIIGYNFKGLLPAIRIIACIAAGADLRISRQGKGE